MAQGDWYYCLTHKAVEPYEKCKREERLGPYPSAEEAAEALKRVAERNEEWETDPRYHEPDEEADDDTEGWGPFRH